MAQQMTQQKSLITQWDEDYDSPWGEGCDGAPWWVEEEVKDRWKTYFSDLSSLSALTPDAAYMSLYDEQLLFVYGSLKRGFPASDMLDGSRFVGRAWTKLSHFVLLKTTEFPAAVFDNQSPKAKAIAGEVYLVPTTEMKHFDSYEGNGSLFLRRRMGVDIEDGTSTVCWMYLANAPTFKAVSEVCPTFTRKKNGLEYYSYTSKGKR